MSATIIDWSDRSHWGGDTPRRCRLCGKDTSLLDSAGRPAHKVCVEIELGVPQPAHTGGHPAAVSSGADQAASHPGATCCGQRPPGMAGNPLVLACQLCPNSPTYWRSS